MIAAFLSESSHHVTGVKPVCITVNALFVGLRKTLADVLLTLLAFRTLSTDIAASIIAASLAITGRLTDTQPFHTSVLLSLAEAASVRLVLAPTTTALQVGALRLTYALTFLADLLLHETLAAVAPASVRAAVLLAAVGHAALQGQNSVRVATITAALVFARVPPAGVQGRVVACTVRPLQPLLPFAPEPDISRTTTEVLKSEVAVVGVTDSGCAGQEFAAVSTTTAAAVIAAILPVTVRSARFLGPTIVDIHLKANDVRYRIPDNFSSRNVRHGQVTASVYGTLSLVRTRIKNAVRRPGLGLRQAPRNENHR